MKAYQQLAFIANESEESFQQAFYMWCDLIGYTHEEAEKYLFTLPSDVAITILKNYVKKQ